MKNKELRNWLACVGLGLSVMLGGCGDGSAVSVAPDNDTVAPGDNTANVRSLSLRAQPATVLTDGAGSTTITVTSLDAGNAAVTGATITLSVDTGILSAPTVTTSTGGQATFTYSSGGVNKANRTATITASVGSITSLLPVQIVGSSVTLDADSTVLTVGGQAVRLNVTAKDSSGAPVADADVAISSSGTGAVTWTPTSGRTGGDGKLAVTVSGTSAGTAALTVSSLGASATKDYTVSTPVAAFGISQATIGAVITANPTVVGMTFVDTLVVSVAAPTSGAQRTVRFVTSMGRWSNGANVQSVTAVGGVATANLTTNQAGVATIQVDDPNIPTDSDTMTVGMTATAPAKLVLQATPTVVQKRIGSTAGTSEIYATVLDANNNPVGGQPVVFSLRDTTGGGESLSSVFGVSAATPTAGLSLGQVKTTFSGGSLSSSQDGVKVHAAIPGSVVETGSGTSSSDVAIVIGGTGGSITFGEAVSVASIANNTAYQHPRSVQVADSNGNPVNGAQVTLSLWPIGFNTGSTCTPDTTWYAAYRSGASSSALDHFASILNDPDLRYGDARVDLLFMDAVAYQRATTLYSAYKTGNSIEALAYFSAILKDTNLGYGDQRVDDLFTHAAAYQGAFEGEDRNENLILDSGEDRSNGSVTDGLIWPNNSTAGTVPGTVTTDANGIATFDHVFTKSNALWTVVRLRAKAIVQGTETLSEVTYTLGAAEADVSPCRLPDSPYVLRPGHTFSSLLR